MINDNKNMKWFVDARFGMFIHYGLFSMLERGEWVSKYSDAVDSDIFTYDLMKKGNGRSEMNHQGTFTAKGNNLYFWVKHWTGEALVLCGLETEVKNVTCLSNGKSYKFEHADGKLTITGLPALAPHPLCTVLKIECAKAPSMYLCGGMRIPQIKHPHYDPCESDIQL